MFCKSCGKEIDNDASFCSFCGANVSSTKNKSDKNDRKVVFSGEVHKCPNCGEVLKAFETKCPSCGYELRGNNVSSSSIESLVKAISNAKNINEKRELISTFYISNTKEDIYEFFTMAISQIDIKNVCSISWCSKIEQVLIKAKLCFDNVEEYNFLEKKYNEKRKQYESEKLIKNIKRILIYVGLIAVIALGITGIVVGCYKAKNYDSVGESPYLALVLFGYFGAFGSLGGIIAYSIVTFVKDGHFSNYRDDDSEIIDCDEEEAVVDGEKKEQNSNRSTNKRNHSKQTRDKSLDDSIKEDGRKKNENSKREEDSLNDEKQRDFHDEKIDKFNTDSINEKKINNNSNNSTKTSTDSNKIKNSAKKDSTSEIIKTFGASFGNTGKQLKETFKDFGKEFTDIFKK